jgi:hypothetical protein
MSSYHSTSFLDGEDLFSTDNIREIVNDDLKINFKHLTASLKTKDDIIQSQTALIRDLRTLLKERDEFIASHQL